jgi:hypothetical protein
MFIDVIFRAFSFFMFRVTAFGDVISIVCTGSSCLGESSLLIGLSDVRVYDDRTTTA